MNPTTGKTTRTLAEQAAYVADYRFGWRAYMLCVPYAGMDSEAERDGYVAAMNAASQSLILTAMRTEEPAIPAEILAVLS